MNISLIFQNLSFLTLYFLAAAALSFILTRLLIAILPQFHMIDEPGGRHQHERSVPCGGGLAIIGSFVIIMGAYLFSSTISGSMLDCPLVKQFLLPTVLITILGLADDRYELKSWQKLLVHIPIGLYFYFVGVKIDHFLSYQLPFWIALPVTVCWVIGIINAFNLIDGMDGLAAGLAMISAFAMAFWFAITGDLNQPISLIVFCGACLGFLYFNFAPARIFMGDTGSMFIGMFFAYFSIICSAKTVTISSLLVPILAMGIPLFDVFLAILRRFYRRYIKHDKNAGIMVGDHDHLHHRIREKMEKNTRKATLVLYALALLLVFGAMGAALLNDMLQTLSFGLLLLVLFVVVRFATIESFNAASMIIDGIHRPHRKFLVTAIHPVIDVSLLVTAYAAAAFLFRYQLFFPVFQWEPVLCCIAPFPVILSISRIYRTYWLRTNVYRFWLLFQMLLLASLLSMSMMFFFFLSKNGLDHIKLFGMEQFVIIFSLCGSGFILLERFLLHYAESYWFQHLAGSLADLKNPLQRTLLYGGGLYCRMFLVSQDNACRGGHVSRKILGIIDDNPTLSHLNIFGMDVLGNCDDLDALLAKYHFNEIVITLRDISPKTRSHLIEFGKKNNIRIQEFRTHLEMYTDLK